MFHLEYDHLDALLEKVLVYFVSREFKEEVQQARAFFFDGLSFGDESAYRYEMRMAQFFDWYLFSRKLSEYRQRPLEVAPTIRGLRFAEKELEMLKQLCTAYHSLFEFIKFKKNHILVIRDLLTKKKFFIFSEKRNYVFQEGEVFEARLIPLSQPMFIFGRGMCLHPPQVRKYILNQVKLLRKNPDLSFVSLALKLNKMRYKWEQYPHVNVEHIYTDKSVL